MSLRILTLGFFMYNQLFYEKVIVAFSCARAVYTSIIGTKNFYIS